MTSAMRRIPSRGMVAICSLYLIVVVYMSTCDCQRHPIREALFLGNETLSENGTGENCIWRRDIIDNNQCPDPDLFFNLYTPSEPKLKQTVDLNRDDWLRSSSWDSTLENIFLIHGYAGGDDTLPIIVLRDAYLRTKRYNVIMVDWGALCQPPCYVAAVHNLRSVAKCAALALAKLQHSGMPLTYTTCVGHSLGAHICGIMSNYLPFRINRIIGLDPARPLVRSNAPLRLDAGDANSVQIIHTNAGKYGEGGRMGHLDVCINGGRTQPYCENSPNEALCSHIWSLCYQAESLFVPRMAEPCGRRCPVGARPSLALSGIPLAIGQAAPLKAVGTYCVNDDRPPFCPLYIGDVGDDRCCLSADTNAAEAQNKTRNNSRPKSFRRMRTLFKRRQLGKSEP